MLADPTMERENVKQRIDNLRSGGGTSVYDAVNSAITRNLAQLQGRKAIVLFTDGVDTTSIRSTYEGSLKSAEEFDGLVYTIQYNTYDDNTKDSGAGLSSSIVGIGGATTPKGEVLSKAYDRANRYLRLLPAATGGRHYFADTPERLKGAFKNIAEELRNQYSLGYYPNNLSSEKKRGQIKVRVKMPDVVVRARKSYIYTPTSQSNAK
jgi:VWFA-related protein